MPAIAVYGARGHTGRFVIAELARRGFTPIAIGRAGTERIADVARPDEIDRALAGAAAVINCAGPFLDTARPLVEAALRARIHYLDVTAEQASAAATLADFADAGACVVPAAGFYGGLADLLATAAGGGETIDVRIALDHWWPTRGTRLTGARNTAPRVVVTNGVLSSLGAPAPTSRWEFPAPFGVQDMLEVPLSEIITLHRHHRAREIHTYLNLAPLVELRAEDTPPPAAIDATGRSAQRFVMEVTTPTAIARATGQDIYASSAPLVVEALVRILAGDVRRVGAGVLGELFDAPAFLAALPTITSDVRPRS
jgi:Saccharopine dehydrogenase NADP binding domain